MAQGPAGVDAISDALPTMHFIDGEWRRPLSGNLMETFDPGRAEPYASFAAGTAEDAAEAGGMYWMWIGSRVSLRMVSTPRPGMP